MTDEAHATARLPVRRLLVDLDTPPAPCWCDGDAFLSAFFNALSMSFPFGEQFFIDSVRAGVAALPETATGTGTQAKAHADALRAQVKGFVGQEATHRHVHDRFNRHLLARGLRNDWERRGLLRLERLKDLDARHALAITAANEHFTALFADWLLAHPTILRDTEPRLRTMWQWHCAEELEHKAVAFDLYHLLQGNDRWRRRWMWRVTVFFVSDVLRQTVSNLRRDGQLWRWRTWRSAWTHLFAPGGLVRSCMRPWWRYFDDDYHPDEHSAHRSVAWLAQHQVLFQPVAPAR